MRLQIDPRLIRLMRQPDYPNLRYYVFTLYDEQEPDWTNPVDGLPGHYLFEVDGLTVLYYVNRERMEPFTRVALVEYESNANED